MYGQGLFRQQRPDIFRPFYETEVPAVEIVVHSYVHSFAQFLYTVEIKMIDWLSMSRDIFVQYCEGRGTDSVFHPELVAYRGRESGLARSHRCMECYDIVAFRFPYEFSRCTEEIICVLYYNAVFHTVI